MKLALIAFCVALLVVLGACKDPGPAADKTSTSPTSAATPGDLIVVNARIFTGVAGQKDAEAMAIQAGRIVYVGDAAGIAAHEKPGIKRIDAGGKRVVPGFIDVHQHTLEAQLPVIDCLIEGGGGDPEAFIAPIKQCAEASGTGWILGHGHEIDDILAAKRAPRLILDDTGHKLPIAIMEKSSHSTWVNTAALKLLKITDATKDPPGGIIVRDKDGQATGLLVDAAGEWPWDAALQPTPALDKVNAEALAAGLAANNANGITTAVDARTYWQRGYLTAYEAAEKAGTLDVRMILSLWASPLADDAKQLAALKKMYRDDGGTLRVSMVKLYDDGLLGNTTAALLAPYLGESLVPGGKGLNYFDEKRLTTYIKALQHAGFRMHIHAIGDRAIHEALNAIAASATAKSGHGHRLTHIEMVAPGDIKRFAKLGVHGDMQLGHHSHDGGSDYYHPLIGKARTAERMFQLRAFADAGVNVALSSDYDVGKLSPLVGIGHAVTLGKRGLPDVAAAVRAYTINAARIIGDEANVGTLEVGKWGDFVVLDKDIFAIPKAAIGKTKPVVTVLGGREVYRAGDPG